MEDKFKVRLNYIDVCGDINSEVDLEFAGSLDDFTLKEFWRYCRRAAAAIGFTEQQIDKEFGEDYGD